MATSRKTTTTAPKKMRGFMCHSSAATAVCTASDPRSVIVPRRPVLGTSLMLDNTRFVNNAKYTRLRDHYSRRFATSTGTNPPVKAYQDRHQDLVKPPSGKPSPFVSSERVFQVVVMRVSLHCQGCAGKVKKHLSKMEGVTSFSIDLETQRVTVMGHLSRVEVLESISKVKRAELWPC